MNAPSVLSKQQLSGKPLTPRQKSTIALGVQKRRVKQQQAATTLVWRQYNAASGPNPTFESEAALADQYGPIISALGKAERHYALRRNRLLENLRKVTPTWEDDLLSTYTHTPSS